MGRTLVLLGGAARVLKRRRAGRACCAMGPPRRGPRRRQEDFMDVIDLLVADHNRVRGLFSRYRAAHEADNTDQASALATEIIKELKIHMAAEEAVFYRAVKERSEEIHEDV